jgi:hypothetical protein
MATEFARAALGTDAVAKDVEVLVGAGVRPDQPELMLKLLRTNKKLYDYFDHHSQIPTITKPQSKL